LFEGRRQLALKHAARELEELTGFGKTACYDALKLEGRFAKNLSQNADGLLCWSA